MAFGPVGNFNPDTTQASGYAVQGNANRELAQNSDHERALEILRAQLQQQGDVSEAQLNQQIELARINGDYNLMQAVLNQGGLTPEQRSAATSRYAPVLEQLRSASGTAGEFTQSGGYSDNEWNDAQSNYGDVRGRLTEIADRGAMTDEEYNRGIASGRQSVLDRFKSAATSGFNALQNKGAATFAGMSVMAQGAREAGANEAAVTANYDQLQANSRVNAAGKLQSLADSQASLAGNRAGNRLSALGQQNSLINTGVGVAGDLAGLDAAPELGRSLGALKDFRAGTIPAMAGGKKGKNKASAMANPVSIPSPTIGTPNLGTYRGGSARPRA